MGAFSLVPEIRKAGLALPTSIPNRRILLADLFPSWDSHEWLESELVRHLASLSQVPPPKGAEVGHKGGTVTSFLSESEPRSACSTTAARASVGEATAKN